MPTQNIFDMTDVWNNLSTTFTAIKMDVTDTQSASDSLLLDLKVGGNSKFKVDKAGIVSFANAGNSYTTVQQRIGGTTTWGFGWHGAETNAWFMFANGTRIAAIGQTRFSLNASTALAWGSVPENPELFIGYRAAANLRLGAADAAGSSSSVTIDFAANANNITWTSHGLMTGSAVMFSAAVFPTSATGNLDANTTYYAVVINSNTIQIARTYDAAVATSPTVIAFTGNGTTVTARGAKTEQTISIQNFTGTDMPGSPLVFDGGQGTGAGNGGPIIFRVAPKGSNGSLVNGLATALTIGADGNALFTGKICVSNAYQPFNWAELRIDANAAWVFKGYAQDVLSLSGQRGNVLTQASFYFGWSADTTIGNNGGDVRLYRDNPGVLALRNGANAQTFSVYKTYTSDTNYERVTYGYSATSGGYGISAEKGSGGGGNNDIYINTQNRLFLDVSQNRAWVISSTRTLYPGNTQSTTMTDNFLNIPGAAGAPTGTPSVTTGFPIYYDSSNHKIYVYSGGVWRSTAALT